MFGRCALVVLMLLVGTVSSTRSQQSGDAHARNDCRLAEQVISTGHPAPHMEWASRVIPYCGASGGDAVAAFLFRTRRATTSETLNRLVESVWGMRDSRIFTTALSVASDRQASENARLQSMRILLSLVIPEMRVSVEEIGKPTRVFEGVSHADAPGGAPLPGDYLRTLQSTLSRVAEDPSATADLREAARFVRSMAQRRG